MSKQHTKETLGFNSFSGYYGSITAGYGGFDFSEVDYLNATYWENVNTNWCDTGYQNVIKGAGEAFTWGYGLFETSNLKESFSLTSMVAASAWDTNQSFELRSYTYKANKGFHMKADDTIYLSQTAQTINFAKIAGGKPTDFKNIAALVIVSLSGSYGNTCTYGKNSYTTGTQLALDNLKVKWNGGIPRGHGGKLVTKGLLPHHLHQAAYVAPHLAGNLHHDDAAGSHQSTSGHHADPGYHSQLLSLPDAHSGGLTAQFQLPAVEHFGS